MREVVCGVSHGGLALRAFSCILVWRRRIAAQQTLGGRPRRDMRGSLRTFFCYPLHPGVHGEAEENELCVGGSYLPSRWFGQGQQ